MASKISRINTRMARPSAHKLKFFRVTAGVAAAFH
jgi:hypothetical protein